jgi:large subunit ribosomal protein L23
MQLYEDIVYEGRIYVFAGSRQDQQELKTVAMDNYGLIIRPLVTEQGMHFASTKSAYNFEVNKKANKTEIKSAVEKIYNVKVRKVRTANRKGKVRRRGRSFGQTSSWKKAVVYLEPDYHIDLF